MREISHNPEMHEQVSSKIDLFFMRHGDKEKDPAKTDYDILLTEKGRGQAQEKSELENIDQAVAFGSPRKRAQETAGHVMAGSTEAIDGSESYEELKEKLDSDLAHGTKLGVDERLDFICDEESEYGKALFQAFKEGRYLKWAVEESDKLAEQLDATEQYSYSQASKGFAELVLKYLQIAPRWEQLSHDSDKYTDTLQRYFGTHQGMAETFLAKVVEKTRGVEERDKLVTSLDNQGFDFVEGIKVEIQNHSGSEPTIHLSYRKEKDGEVLFDFDEDINKDLLQEIVEQK
jgi:bisphosphoglycerate-dependent phosphoglycerate mutase